MRIALGTAQFGLEYGVTNSVGRVRLSDVKEILRIASGLGVDTLDTAAAYGDSESSLGSVGVSQFKIITKFPTLLDSRHNVVEWVNRSLDNALAKLNLRSLYGVLFHRSSQLVTSASTEILHAIDELKSAGVIEKFGVSIYDPAELEAITSLCMPDIVQAPLNVFDRRLVSSGWLEKLHDSGVEVHTRSAFLQGLLLCPRERVPGKFEAWHKHFDDWHEWLDRNALSPMEASLAAVTDSRISRVIVGVESVSQLEQILQSARCVSENTFPLHLSTEDRNLIDPSNWDRL